MKESRFAGPTERPSDPVVPLEGSVAASDSAWAPTRVTGTTLAPFARPLTNVIWAPDRHDPGEP